MSAIGGTLLAALVAHCAHGSAARRRGGAAGLRAAPVRLCAALELALEGGRDRGPAATDVLRFVFVF